MKVLDGNLKRIENQIGSLGASTSRFHTAMSVLQTQRDDYVAASSRITDTDVAEESANLVRTQITQQAAAAVLAQANQQPALAIQLLR